MDLRQLHSLVAVHEHGSFSAAARSLHTVQSNVSTHIARLERSLGARLVDRASGRLTEEGEAALARARRVMAELDGMVADVAALRDEVVGTVRVGVIGTVGRWVVPLLLGTLAHRHPAVETVFVDATTTSLVPRLVAGGLDAAIVNLPVPDPAVATEPLFDEDRVLVAPAGHALAGRDRVSIADLAAHPLLLEPVGTAFRDELDAETARAGVALRAWAEVDGMRLVASLAEQGLAAAILPATAVSADHTGALSPIPIEGLARRQVGLARRRSGRLAAPARAFRQVLFEVLSSDSAARTGVHLRFDRGE